MHAVAEAPEPSPLSTAIRSAHAEHRTALELRDEVVTLTTRNHALKTIVGDLRAQHALELEQVNAEIDILRSRLAQARRDAADAAAMALACEDAMPVYTLPVTGAQVSALAQAIDDEVDDADLLALLETISPPVARAKRAALRGEGVR